MADLGFLPDRPAAARGHPGRRPADAVLRHARRRRRRARRGGSSTDPAVHSVDPTRLPPPMITPRAHRRARGPGRRGRRAGRRRSSRSLVFTRTKHGAQKLARQLTAAGIPAAELHGNLAQNARERNLAAFASGAVRVLVATDIAARGIHVDGIDLVIHADPPAEHKAYLHRSGRTARAGASGHRRHGADRRAVPQCQHPDAAGRRRPAAGHGAPGQRAAGDPGGPARGAGQAGPPPGWPDPASPAGLGYQPGPSAGRCRASTCSWVSRSAARRASPFRQKMIGGLSAPL